MTQKCQATEIQNLVEILNDTKNKVIFVQHNYGNGAKFTVNKAVNYVVDRKCFKDGAIWIDSSENKHSFESFIRHLGNILSVFNNCEQ